MKKDLKITISGMSNSGKSTITYLLKQFLEERGFDVHYDGGIDYINSIEMFNYIVGNTIVEKEKAIKPNVCIQFEEVNTNTKDVKNPALLRQLKINNVLNTEMFYGEILEIDENNVCVYCMIDTGVFQERKFSKELFSHISGLKVNDYVSIVTKTNPGLLLVQVFEVKEDISYLFKRPNYFEGLEKSFFFEEK